jgi:hypothetical protein
MITCIFMKLIALCADFTARRFPTGKVKENSSSPVEKNYL